MKKVLPFIFAIVFVVAMSVPAFAFEYDGLNFDFSDVTLPKPYGANTSYYMYNSLYGPQLIAMNVSQNEYYVLGEYNKTIDNLNTYDIKIVFPEQREVTYYKFDLNTGEFKYDAVSNTNGYNAYDLSLNSIYYSSVDIKTADGHLLFQGPLTLEGAVQNSLTAEAERLTQTLMIIALCGVGCLAFLILLPTLKKVFSHFRIN